MGLVQKALENIFAPNIRSGAVSNALSFLPGVVSNPKHVNESSALCLSAFFNGVELIENSIAILPKSIFKKEANQRIKFKDHSAYNVLANEPNNYMTSFVFHRTMVRSLLLKGNAYALIERNNTTGNVVALHFIPANEVVVYKKENSVFYKYKGQIYSSHEIIHIANSSSNGIVGQSVIQHAAESLGISLSAQKYASDVYEDKGLGYGVIETEKSLNPDPKKAIIKGFNDRMTGAGNFKTAVLDEGFKYKSITLSPTESKFIETQASGVLDIARWLNLYPHKLKHLDNANFSNVYQMEIAHVQDSIMPYVVMFEQEYNKKLFNDVEKATVYTKFNVNALLRASLKDKADYNSKMIFAGVVTRNEVRELEDLNPLDGLDDPLTPVNTYTLAQIAKNLKDE